MSYFRTGDPLDDFDRVDREQARREERLPVCEHCGGKIHDEHYYEVGWEIYCEECMIEKFRRNTDDLLEA